MTEQHFRDLSINMPITGSIALSQIDDLSEEQLASLRRYREDPVQIDGNIIPWQEEFYNMTMNNAPHSNVTVRRSRVRRTRVRPQFTYEKCVRPLTEKEGQCTNADQCAICFDTHVLGDSMETQCNHGFGKECYNNWMTTPRSNGTCPSCRTFCPKVYIYEVYSNNDL